MIIKIEALDTLFFKDGKPFSMGEESWADGIFPPPPSVIYGALRSAYFGQNPTDFNRVGTTDDPTNNLIIKGIYFLLNDEIHFPVPLDYVKIKNDNENKQKVFPLRISEFNSISNSSVKNVLRFKNKKEDEIKEIESSEGSLVRRSKFMDYLEGKNENFSVTEILDLMLSEPKVGIGRNNLSRTTDESKLYRVGMRRFESNKKFQKETEKLSMLVEFDNLKLNDNGFFKLGAEGKVINYSTKVENNLVPLPKIKGNLFKIYLLTPALFRNGWLPDFKEHPNLKDLELELITASIGKTINIGGFDMQKKMPKPMRKAVPSGSVYYLKSEKDDSTFRDRLNGKSISDFNSQEGFGICLIGGVND